MKPNFIQLEKARYRIVFSPFSSADDEGWFVQIHLVPLNIAAEILQREDMHSIYTTYVIPK